MEEIAFKHFSQTGFYDLLNEKSRSYLEKVWDDLDFEKQKQLVVYAAYASTLVDLLNNNFSALNREQIKNIKNEMMNNFENLEHEDESLNLNSLLGTI